MKPSELLKLELDLRDLGNDLAYERALSDFVDATDRAISPYSNIFGGGVKNNYETVKQKAQESVRRVHGPIIDLADHIQEIRKPLEVELANQFYHAYKTIDKKLLTYKWIRKTLPIPSKDDMDNFHAIIRSCANWKHSGCIIRPVNTAILDQIVAADPMYVLDYNLDLIKIYLESFNEQYQRRVRQLELKGDDFTDGPKLSQLPHQQLGLFIAYNFFNFIPFPIIASYLKEIYVKLKPGGHLIFTYNNCNYPYGLGLCESQVFSYTKSDQMADLLISLGYQIEREYTNKYDFHYFYATKPGNLTSIRGGQTLCKISPTRSEDLIEPSSQHHDFSTNFLTKIFNMDRQENIKYYSADHINALAIRNFDLCGLTKEELFDAFLAYQNKKPKLSVASNYLNTISLNELKQKGQS